MNKEALKRWSTYANALSGAVAAAMIYIPNIGLEATTTAQVMLACNVLVAICQSVKQRAPE